MRLIPTALAVLTLTVAGFTAQAQKIKLVEGDLSVLSNQTKINVLYTYDKMGVGKFDKEEEYVASKVADYNKKEPGRGDTWAKNWVNDRTKKFEPKFLELFNENSDIKIAKGKNIKYTMIFHTTFTEPGWNVGVARHNAEINSEILIVDAEDNSHVLAKISLDKAKGRTFGGYDFDTGSRLAESYALAGKKLAKFIKKKAKA